MPVVSPSRAAIEALERLAAAMDTRDFATTLVTGEGQAPFLTVTNRHAQLSEDVFVDGQSYFWPWRQAIAAVGNPKAAATKVSHVLAAAPGSRG